jgi:hypothetical protein
MAHILLKTALSEFESELTTVEKYASCAQRWAAFTYPRGVPRFAPHHRDKFVEMAFLSAFQAWEEFLEETFTLYLLGKKSPTGKGLQSHVPVRTRDNAKRVLLGPRPYLDWSPYYQIKKHNKNMFKDHKNTCFYSLNTIESPLDEISDVRNAIAHRSESSSNKFKTIVRSKLAGSYPPNLSVGGFLMTTVPSSSPPATFLDDYLEQLRYGASLVVPM